METLQQDMDDARHVADSGTRMDAIQQRVQPDIALEVAAEPMHPAVRTEVIQEPVQPTAPIDTTDEPTRPAVVPDVADEPLHADIGMDPIDEPIHADIGMDPIDEPIQLDIQSESMVEPIQPEGRTDDRAPVPQPIAFRPVPEPYTPASATHRLNLPALELIASPFRSFREIGRFQQTLSTLPGVQTVQPRQLQRGVLQLRVECRNAREMLRALSIDYPTPFSLISQEMHQVEIAFDEGTFPQLVETGAFVGERGA